ncbi:MAG: D-glycero-beta-D-manno-heptose 1-phosphate adenylyltransferase [Bacteroidales bacterium]|jgi:rfaE bifunctional protein nucleotidyltransferase chain/domain|nr:D-glycero-beta-D-manno-heptose 1-phosphate adenylyltransferase [Bacteroidales bacterium]
MNSIAKIKQKIQSQESLDALLSRWKNQNKKIVFTNGCFDILHRGHIEYLSKAADLGDVLFIGVNTDSSVRKLKGNNRPLQDENSRLLILGALEFVDALILFDEDTPYDLIKMVQPHILVKGSDYKPEDIVGYDIVKARGGEIKTIDFLQGYSTSDIEQRIKQG